MLFSCDVRDDGPQTGEEGRLELLCLPHILPIETLACGTAELRQEGAVERAHQTTAEESSTHLHSVWEPSSTCVAAQIAGGGSSGRLNDGIASQGDLAYVIPLSSLFVTRFWQATRPTAAAFLSISNCPIKKGSASNRLIVGLFLTGTSNPEALCKNSYIDVQFHPLSQVLKSLSPNRAL